MKVWRVWVDVSADDIDAVSRWHDESIGRCPDHGLVFEGGFIGPQPEEDE